MSPRHAHSKRRRWDPPRTYNASTGLTGVSEAELAHRTEITEAAMALAEASAAKAARSARGPRSAHSAPKAPRFTLPKTSRAPAEGPPRVFSLPAESVPSSEPGEAGQHPAPTTMAEKVGSAEPVRALSPGVASPSAPSPESHTDGPTAPEPVARSRAAASRLSATAAATEAALARAVKAAKPDKTRGAVGPAGAVPPKAPSLDSPSTRPVPKASRAPKGGSRWRTGTTPQAGVANRRPMSKTRPASAPSAEPGSRRFALPLVGRGSEESDTGAKSGAKAPAGASETTTPRRNPFSRTAPSSKSPTTKSAAAKKKPAKPKTPVTPQERRQRIPLVLAAVFAVAVLATSFPLSSLLSQHRQLAAAASQLQQVQTVNRALTQQQHALDSNVAVNQLARSNYQMVTPGQTLYDVLPPSHSTATSTPGSATSGDPGSQPLVAPANAPDLSPQPGLPQPIPTSAAGSSSGATVAKSGTSTSSNAPIVPPGPTTFWGRVSDTLQFWK